MALVPRPASGRTYSMRSVMRLGDADPSGRLRLDALARLLQDVANADVVDALGDAAFGWVVRRTTLQVVAWPKLGERLELTTWGSGIGSRWAERRTSVVGDGGGSIEAASLWVCIDVATGRPRRLDPGFHAAYDEAIAGREVGAKKTHADPPADGTAVPGPPWSVRRSDLDVLGHVNNAVYLAMAEEAWGGDRMARPCALEVEYRGGLDLGDPVELLRADDRLWVLGAGAVVATVVLG